MVKKIHSSDADTSSDSPKAAGAHLAGSVKDSAQQIWLAGLGAFAKAQEEGGKMFETLVKEGLSIQRKTQTAAEEKITEATARMTSMATGLSSKAAGQWDKLETIFEDRVGKALHKLGVPSAKDIDALITRIDALNDSVNKLSAKRAPSSKASPTSRTAPAKAAARRTAPRKSA